jgi:hypothetical protein
VALELILPLELPIAYSLIMGDYNVYEILRVGIKGGIAAMKLKFI